MTFDPVIVSATAGPLPETVEQITALRAQGATSVDVVITQPDMVDAELLELVELEVRDLIERSGATVGSITRAPGSPGPPGSSVPYGPPS
jgi:translation elongation factor EF-Tu-like GTPase